MDTFEYDEAIDEFLALHEGIHIDDHKFRFTIDLDSIAYFSKSIQYSSHTNVKNKRKKDTSLGENYTTPFDEKIVKIKDVFEGENLSKVPEDGSLEFFPIT
jgi:hypothetical protein